jgi:hypothetical protein
VSHGRRKTGHLELEATEMAVRSAMHEAGAAALARLLQWEAPAAGQRTLPCPCGQQAHYRELRSKTILTAVGTVEVSRPYYQKGAVAPSRLENAPAPPWGMRVNYASG